jgi:hypothetical protein
VNTERPRDEIDPSVRMRLEEFYAPHNERLAALLVEAGTADTPAWLRTHRRV